MSGRDRFYFTLLSLLTLALAGWYGWRWHMAARQDAQGREQPAALGVAPAGPVTGYALSDSVPVEFVRYGTVVYNLEPVRFTPQALDDEVRVAAAGYEPVSRPWMRHRSVLTGRHPHIAVYYHEFASETSARAARLEDRPDFIVDFSDPRGITCLRRAEPLPLEPNEIAVVRHGREVWVFDAVDDPVGLRAIAAAGFRYGQLAPAAAPPMDSPTR